MGNTIKKGDIIILQDDISKISLIAKKGIYEHNSFYCIDYYYMVRENNIGASNCKWLMRAKPIYHIASEEERKNLFDTMRRLGKEWNQVKMKVEPINHSFKRGSFLRSGNKIVISGGKSDDLHTSILATLFIDKKILSLGENVITTNEYNYASSSDKKLMLDALSWIWKKWNPDKLIIEDINL